MVIRGSLTIDRVSPYIQKLVEKQILVQSTITLHEQYDPVYPVMFFLAQYKVYFFSKTEEGWETGLYTGGIPFDNCDVRYIEVFRDYKLLDSL